MVLLGLQDFTPTPEVPLASPGPKFTSLLGSRKVKLPDLPKDLMNRLKRIEGQVRGVENMLENGVYCTDILIQVSAINSALNSFNKVLLSEHIKTCVRQDVAEGKEDTLDELVSIMQKLMK